MNRNTNPNAHRQGALCVIRVPYNVASHLKILIPVGTAMIIVTDVKYARVSTSIPTVNDQTRSETCYYALSGEYEVKATGGLTLKNYACRSLCVEYFVHVT